MSIRGLEYETGMTPRRLESLADAVFAFAMTILVLSINMPEAGNIGNISDFLMSQSQNFLNFFLSFFLLALYWMGYSQQFHHVRKTDGIVLMLSVFILMFVVMVPFSTSLMNDYSRNITAEFFFNGNLLVLTSLLTLNWAYLDRKDMLSESLAPEHIARVTRRSLFMPLIPLTALILAFIIPGWSSLVYLLIPILSFRSSRSSRKT